MAVVQIQIPPKLRLEKVSLGELTWFNVEKPTELETRYLSENYPFHPLDLDDVLSKRQRPNSGKDDQNLLRGIGSGGKRVRGKDRQTNALADCLMGRIGSLKRAPGEQMAEMARRFLFARAMNER